MMVITMMATIMVMVMATIMEMVMDTIMAMVMVMTILIMIMMDVTVTIMMMSIVVVTVRKDTSLRKYERLCSQKGAVVALITLRVVLCVGRRGGKGTRPPSWN